MRFNFYGDQIEVKFESRVGEPWESWLRLMTSGVVGVTRCATCPFYCPGPQDCLHTSCWLLQVRLQDGLAATGPMGTHAL
jgi:hypothetical protein